MSLLSTPYDWPGLNLVDGRPMGKRGPWNALASVNCPNGRFGSQAGFQGATIAASRRWTSKVFSHGAPFRRRDDLRLPALSF